MVAGGGFEQPTFGLCDLTHLSMRVGLYLHPRGVLAIQSLRLPPTFQGLGSVLPYRSRDVGSNWLPTAKAKLGRTRAPGFSVMMAMLVQFLRHRHAGLVIKA